MHLLTRLATAAVLAGILPACAETGPVGSFHVTIENASQSTMSDVHVATGPNDQIVASKLQPGERSGDHIVSEMYENPVITLTVGGRPMAYQPVEGFVPGFNHPLPAGTYTITLSVDVNGNLRADVK